MPYIYLEDVRLYYEIHGSGKPIVLIHHLGGSSKSWRDVVLPLSEEFMVIVYDLRGHGRSSVPPLEYTISDHARDLRNLIDYLRLDNPILVGHSIGSLIALEYSLQYHLDKMLLIGALYKSPNPEPYWIYVNIASQFGMRALAEYRRIKGDFPDSLTKNSKAWLSLNEVYSENSPLGYRNTVEGLLHAKDYSQFLSRLNTSLRLIYGSLDNLSKNLETFKLVPKIKYKIIDGYGHLLNFECPDILAKSILELLND
ncbi:alpha/beta hydrolase [Candidatus Acidianus copahuensis]|uniref:Alpha/beta hydrolase n=1 Tax=Candidatus Acidianus copahuensis TaxID=1160895 RepID=A0A031LNP6_9CREN|nr:alpha/beta hydrolase [Candidatus Acidianus copahuensis]EZQ03184.1 alpha/beta hydrolase [Candidatus Acidianus copahuensis]